MGPEASAAKRHMVASAIPAPAAMASHNVDEPNDGNGPNTASASVSRRKPESVTPAVVWTYPIRRLDKPARRSSVPQESAATVPEEPDA